MISWAVLPDAAECLGPGHERSLKMGFVDSILSFIPKPLCGLGLEMCFELRMLRRHTLSHHCTAVRTSIYGIIWILSRAFSGTIVSFLAQEER